MKKIIVADDHAIVRQGLKMLLSDIPDFEIAREAETGKEFLEILSKERFDLIILDIGLPDMDVYDILYQIKQNKIETPILIFTMNPEKFYAKRILKSGAMGYINKSSSQNDIIDAITSVSKGELYVSKELAKTLVSDMVNEKDMPLHETLTGREFQVMKQIAAGKSLSDIADEFYISKATISNHRANILKKLKLENNFELIQYTIKNGI